MLYVKFEKLPDLFYVNFPSYFKQWNLNEVVIFLSLSAKSILGFLNVGLWLLFQVFGHVPKTGKDFNIPKMQKISILP